MQSEFRTHHANRRVFVIVLALALGACGGATTQIDQAWVAPSAAPTQQMQRVATVYLSDNVTMRHSAEDKLASDLYQIGVRAMPSYAVLGDAIDVKDIDNIKTRLRNQGFDGMVTMKVVERQQEIESSPSYDWYWGWYGYGYPGYGYGGDVYTETIYRLETSAYDLRTNSVVWSVMTKTTEPENAQELINDTSKVVTRKFVPSLQG
jgi:hypothetical protein